MEELQVYTPPRLLVDLFERVFEIPLTYENRGSVQDLCFLMNSMGIIYGDTRFVLSLEGPKSIKLEMQLYDYFHNPPYPGTSTKEIRHRPEVLEGIHKLKSIKESLDNSTFSREEIEKNIDNIYFMNAVAIAKYIMIINEDISPLDLLNRIKPKYDVNAQAVIAAKNLNIDM